MKQNREAMETVFQCGTEKKESGPTVSEIASLPNSLQTPSLEIQVFSYMIIIRHRHTSILTYLISGVHNPNERVDHVDKSLTYQI